MLLRIKRIIILRHILKCRIRNSIFSHRKHFIAKDLAENPCQPDPLGCLSDQVKDNIDRISCVVEKQKWSDTLLQIGKEATYPACEIGKIEEKWENYTDSLFIDVSV